MRVGRQVIHRSAAASGVDVPVRSSAERHDEPTASAHLTISLTKLDSSIQVPAGQGRYMITLFASLTGLAIMAVICPVVTLHEGRHVLPPGWMIFFLIFELAAAVFVAALPYRQSRMDHTSDNTPPHTSGRPR
jgi:hypothetical protein